MNLHFFFVMAILKISKVRSCETIIIKQLLVSSWHKAPKPLVTSSGMRAPGTLVFHGGDSGWAPGWLLAGAGLPEDKPQLEVGLRPPPASNLSREAGLEGELIVEHTEGSSFGELPA